MPHRLLDHEELASRLEKRLDKIEHKLDLHLQKAAANEVDLRWIKGYVKLSLTVIVAIGTGMVTTMFKVFIT